MEKKIVTINPLGESQNKDIWHLLHTFSIPSFKLNIYMYYHGWSMQSVGGKFCEPREPRVNYRKKSCLKMRYEII